MTKTIFICTLMVLSILSPLSQTNAADNNRETYEAAKVAYEQMQGPFSEAKSKVDATYEFFERFHKGIDTWRNAVSKETQNRGIEEIDKLADDHIEAAIDALFNKAKSSLGLPDAIAIPQSMKEKAVEKLRERFKGQVPPRLANRLGYMYTLSALDRKLRDNYIYKDLKHIKRHFDKGNTLLKNFNYAINFIDTFSPHGVELSPVGRLKKVKDFLSIISDFAKPVPLMEDIINGYASATEGFMVALNALDQRLKEARQGSLCGQRDVDKDIQETFQRAYPDEDCLTYFSLSSAQYPHLSPIRAWEGGNPTKTFLWHNGQGVILLDSNFSIMYHYFAALKDSYSYNGYVDHDRFINIARAVTGRSHLPVIADRFRTYYQRFEKDYGFKEVLEAEGLYKTGNYYSLSGRMLEYQIGGREDEFGGLCFYNAGFRNNIEAIYNKYKDAYVINGTIESSMPNANIGNISVLIDGVNPKELRCAEQCTFRHIALAEKYTVAVAAEGYKEIKRTFVKVKYPLITLVLASIKIESDKQSLMLGEKVWFRAIVAGRDTSKDRFYWYAKGRPFGGNGDRVQYSTSEPGLLTITVTLVDEMGRPVLEGRHSINVTESLSLSIVGPSEALRGAETAFSAQFKSGLFQQRQFKYGYSWAVNGAKYASNDNSIRVKFDKTGNHSIKVVAWQWIAEQNRWQKMGEASHYVVVKAPQQALSLPVSITGPSSGYVGNNFTFYANVENPYRLRDIIGEPQLNISFSWSLNGRPYGGHEGTQRIRFDSQGHYTIVATAFVWHPKERRWINIGNSRYNFEAFTRLYTSRNYPLTPNTPTPTPKPSPTPTPTPKVRQFSELSKEKQQSVLNCLCRCNSVATGTVLVYYDTKPNDASPACSDLKNGPCVNEGFGCWRHVPVNTGQCADRCYENANVQGVPQSLMNAGK